MIARSEQDRLNHFIGLTILGPAAVLRVITELVLENGILKVDGSSQVSTQKPSTSPHLSIAIYSHSTSHAHGPRHLPETIVIETDTVNGD
jgi:hypothetical protein